jgi:hypothetical protein
MENKTTKPKGMYVPSYYFPEVKGKNLYITVNEGSTKYQSDGCFGNIEWLLTPEIAKIKEQAETERRIAEQERIEREKLEREKEMKKQEAERRKHESKSIASNVFNKKIKIKLKN